MTKKVIDARQVLESIRGGMSDTSLMETYGLSSRGLQSLFQKLVSAGLMTQDEVDDRAPLTERTIRLEVHRCPACNMPQLFEFDECPQCGVIVSKFKKKYDLATVTEEAAPPESGGRQGGGDGTRPAVAVATVSADSSGPPPGLTLSKIDWQFKTQGQIVASPAQDNGWICFGSLDANFYCVELETGLEKWRIAVDDPIRSSPAIANGIAYVGTLGGILYAVEMATGKEKWRFDTSASLHTGAVVHQGFVYVGNANGTVFALNAETGSETARFDLGTSISASPIISQGRILVGCTDGHVYAIG
jgi:outer membrane protein assembly factor BamB